MTAVIGQHVPHLGYHLGIFETCIFSKYAAYLFEINRKHEFRLKYENIKEKIWKKRKYNEFPFVDLNLKLYNYFS